jgi:hypothetical protein
VTKPNSKYRFPVTKENINGLEKQGQMVNGPQYGPFYEMLKVNL